MAQWQDPCSDFCWVELIKTTAAVLVILCIILSFRLQCHKLKLKEHNFGSILFPLHSLKVLPAFMFNIALICSQTIYDGAIHLKSESYCKKIRFVSCYLSSCYDKFNLAYPK